MKRSRLMCITAVLALLGAAPARAAILWQQSFDPHPSGVTQVALHTPNQTLQSLYLYIDGGTFKSVDMRMNLEWQELWWEYDHYYGEWYLWGNEYFKTVYSEMHPSFRMSQLIYDRIPSFYHCNREPKVIWETCAQTQLDQYSHLWVESAVVASHERFTLTLSNERLAVPEPLTWALMVVGFGGVGSMLRRSRRRTAPVIS